MNTRKKTISSRVIAFVTAAIFILYAVPMCFDNDDVKASGNSAHDKEVITFPSGSVTGAEPSDLTHEDTLYDNGNGTFTFKSVVSASYSFSDESQSRARTQDGYFEINKAGKYLVELWGGDGGKGSQLPLVNYEPGEGGKGGFVYGVLNITDEMIGKKLYYEVGSNGKSITRSIDDGGSGGIGGGAGSITLISVGAGGGYSALYLIDDDDLSNGVIRESSKDDPDKVIMIAGGGGGGGAGSNLLPVPVGTPDGGDGGTLGSLEGNASVPVTIGNTKKVFDGKYYAGKDGSSSGKKTTYTGKGGTDVPGEVNNSVLGVFDASAYPNDWLKTYHPDGDRGAGGAGNLRGGGGGAGFAGGSGGLQLTAVAAENVGGGGGGSSYITGKEGLITPWTKANKDAKQYFTENNTNKGVGGSVIIRYIPTGSNTYDYLDSDVTISGKISKYFDIVDKDTTGSGDGNAPSHIDIKNDNTFSVTGLISPENNDKITLGETKNKLTYSLVLKPKDNFKGGNDVPIFAEDVTCVSSYQNNSNIKSVLINSIDKPADDKDESILKYKVQHANVPFRYQIKTKNLAMTVADIESKKQENQKPYTQDYLIDGYDSTPNEFTKSISALEVTGPNAGAKDFTTAETEGVYVYIVRLFVTPDPNRTGEYSVGQPNGDSSVITANAVVQIFKEIPIDVDGLQFSVQKDLTYDNGYYDMSVDMKVSNEYQDEYYTYEFVEKKHTYNFLDAGESSVQLDPGYYYIEAYGGDGGKGASGGFAGVAVKGGDGGKGGYVTGFIGIDEKITLSLTIGAKGVNGDSNLFGFSNSPGQGGKGTVIKNGEDILLVAAGGGGGGRGFDNGFGTTAYIGATGLDAGETITEINNKHDGANGPEKSLTQAEPGANYKKTVSEDNQKLNAFINKVPDGIVDITKTNSFTKLERTNGTGSIRITRLDIYGGYQNPNGTVVNTADAETVSDINNSLTNYLTNFTFNSEFSKYWDIEKVVAEGDIEFSDNDVVKNDQNLKVTINLPYDSSDNPNFEPVAENPAIKTTKHIYQYRPMYSFTVKIRLKPKPGFLGGNDVPLLNVKKTEEITDDDEDDEYMNESQTEMSIYHKGNTDDSSDDKGYVKRNNVTDWANVEVDSSGFEAVANDQTVTCGHEIQLDSLVRIKNPIENSDADWKTEFVSCETIITHINSTEQINNNTERIFKDTDYVVSVNLKPEHPAQKAKVIPSVEGMHARIDAHVTVQYEVKYILDHLAVDRVSFIPPETDSEGNPVTSDQNYEIQYPVTLSDKFRISDISSENYTAEITPVGGYRLPKTASVSGVSAGGYTTVNQGGKITVTIPKENIRNNITIRATALPVPHKVHYIYETVDSSGNKIIETFDDPADYYNGAEITDKTGEIKSSAAPAPAGYEGYEWTWPDGVFDVGSDKYVMGDEDVYVVGRYTQKIIKLKIRYYRETFSLGKTTKTYFEEYEYNSPEKTTYDSETGIWTYALKKGDHYSVKSPEISGYTANELIVEGDIDINFNKDTIEKEVKYTVTTDNLFIYYYYLNSDDEIEEGELKTKKYISANKPYSESISTPSNYTLKKITQLQDDNEIVVNSISVRAESNKKYIYYVYFSPVVNSPVTVNVTYNPSGGSADITSRLAVVGKEYGFIPDPDDPSKGKYGSLPKAARSGYIFDGWFTSGGTLINEESKVSVTEDHTLYAHWKSSNITIRIEYIYADDVKDTSRRGQPVTGLPDDTITETTVTYNMSYSFKIPPVDGYEPDKQVVKGIAQEDTTIPVYYSDLTVLTLNIYSSDEDYDYGHLNSGFALKGGTFELVAADDTVIATADNTSGTITWTSNDTFVNNKTLERGQTYTLRCLSPPLGYRKYSAEITLENFKTEKNVFLEPSFVLPFTGTTDQTIYYCVGAGIMLIAAVLLYKTLKNEK